VWVVLWFVGLLSLSFEYSPRLRRSTKAEICFRLNSETLDGITIQMTRALTLLILLFSGCSSGADRAKVVTNCAQQLPGFHSLNDPDFTRRWPVGIEGYQYNTVKIAKTGALSWNGTDLATMHDDGLPSIEQFLIAMKSFPARQPFTLLDFDVGAPCEKVKAVRNLMVKHLGCENEDLCFQGNWNDHFSVKTR
jgi:hypothetical protein